MKSLKKVRIKNKKVIIRLDLDLPRDKDGKILDDSRLMKSLPTLNFLKKAKQVIIMGHGGRPKKYEKCLSFDKIALRLSKLLNTKIAFMEESITVLPKEKFVMLENLRFHPFEKQNNPRYAKVLASYADIYVNDAFANSHRKHASMVAITKFLPSYPGFDLEKEVKNTRQILNKPKHPLILLIGSKKVDKLHTLGPLIKRADAVLIGGAMMFTFMKALKQEVGRSYYEKEEVALAKQLIKNKKIILPIDVLLDNKKTVPVENMHKSSIGYDIGEQTPLIYSEILKKAKTVIWNGPMGYVEGGFTKATNLLAKTLINSKVTSLVGGGETAMALKSFLTKFTHSTTAGGAFLDLIAGRSLPAVKALETD